MGGRVVEGARLESAYRSKAYRGFESHLIRHVSPAAAEDVSVTPFGFPRGCLHIIAAPTIRRVPGASGRASSAAPGPVATAHAPQAVSLEAVRNRRRRNKPGTSLADPKNLSVSLMTIYG